MKITFKLKDKQHIDIMDGKKKIGHIFTPSGSGSDPKSKDPEEKASIQVCGFAEAFDYWGCGIFKGFKDIQLFFNEDLKMRGKFNEDIDLRECVACYMIPCQCEVKRVSSTKERIIKSNKPKKKTTNPFIVKRHEMLPKLVERRKEQDVEDEI